MASRILLVDDNREFLDSTRDILEVEGYEVLTADSGEDALRMMASESFQVVLMDMKMPGMNGVESYLAMKRENPAVQAILITAYPKDDLVRVAMEEGVRAVLTKPLDMEGLLRQIEELSGGEDELFFIIADDDADFCASLIDALGIGRNQVAVALDGNEALRLAESKPVDVLLLDMKIPPWDGLDTYRHIRKLRPDAACVIITGYPQEYGEHMRQAMKEHVHACLIKPIDIAKLVRILEEIARNRNTMRNKRTR